MAEGNAASLRPSVDTQPGSNGSNLVDITEEQIMELENIFCRGQYSDDEIAMQAVINASSADFLGVPAPSIATWFRHRATGIIIERWQAVQTSAVELPAVDGQTSQQADAQLGAEQRRRQNHEAHDSKRFVRTKKSLFQHMERFSATNPGADVLLIITSPCSLGLWADGRGPYLNCDSVLKSSAQKTADVLKDAAEKSRLGTLDWNHDPGQRWKRDTAHKGGGYMAFQSGYRQTAKEELTAEGVVLTKGVIERRCRDVWIGMPKEHQADYHRQPSCSNDTIINIPATEQRSIQAAPQAATGRGGRLHAGHSA